MFQPRILLVSLVVLAFSSLGTSFSPANAQSAVPPVDASTVPAPGTPALAAPATPAVNPGATAVAVPKIGSIKYQVVEGPLVTERSAFYAKLLEAKKHGFGVSAYITAFDAIEQSVKAGISEDELTEKLEPLTRGLTDQIKRMKILKVQKPAPPIAASGPAPSEMEQTGGGGHKKFSGLGAGKQGEFMDIVKDKWFGGEIPESIKSKIPAGVDPSMLNTPEGQELLKKLNNR